MGWCIRSGKGVRRIPRQNSVNIESVDLGLHRSAVSDLQAQSGAPGFWDHPASAQASLRELASHERIVTRVTEWSSQSQEALDFLELCVEGDDSAMLDEAESILSIISADLDAFELDGLLDGRRSS